MGMGLGIEEWSIGFELGDVWSAVVIRESFWEWGMETLYTRDGGQAEHEASGAPGSGSTVENEGRRTKVDHTAH